MSDVAALPKKRGKLLDALREYHAPPDPADAIPEAGRKVMLGEFIKMLEHEPGSRTGADIEDVHKMRVAIRQMRSAFRLLAAWYKTRTMKVFDRDLRAIMQVLGRVRDLDVMIHDLDEFKTMLDPQYTIILQEVIDLLDQRREVAREDLIVALDSKPYRRFVKRFAQFLTTPDAGAATPDKNGVTPFQVRHVLPTMIYDKLAHVRAYEVVLDDADEETLHDLRIEFKRLRYAIALFSNVLGAKADDFIDELKVVQDYLGRLNDISVAQARLKVLMDDLEGHQNGVVWLYIDHLEEQKPELLAQMPEVWRRFNTKSVQRKLASAVVTL